MKTFFFRIQNNYRTIIMAALICAFSYVLRGQDNEQILKSFVESYKNDPMALTANFGIAIGDEWWHVKAKRHQEGYKVGKKKQYTFHNFGPHEVSLHKGMPDQPTWYFQFANAEVLENINTKKWTASTAAAKSTAEDKVGLDILVMEGYDFSLKDDAISYQALEHFWKKDDIEITRFERDNSLPSHGASLVALYTMKDKRIGWFSLGTDEAANADRNLDKGQVPNLMIFTKGRGKGQFGEQEFDIEPGMSVFIPPYVKHIIYNPNEEPLEGIIVLFGDNIGFARGQSYLDFLEQEYSFLERNEQQVIEQVTLAEEQ